MFGECHAHLFMDGVNYKEAVRRHSRQVGEADLRGHLQAYADKGVTFLRDGGDYLGVSRRGKELAGEYGIDYRTPVFAIHKEGHYGGIVGRGFSNLKEYHGLVLEAAAQGCDFIKIMTTGIMDFATDGSVIGEDLAADEVREMIHIAHEEGFAVMSHTNGDQAVRDVVEAGADSVEHGNFMSRDTLDLLADTGTVWVPTISTIYNLIDNGRFENTVLKRLYEKASDNLCYAYEKGVRAAMGSDAGAYCVPHGKGIMDEYEVYRKNLGYNEKIDGWIAQGECIIRERFRRQA